MAVDIWFWLRRWCPSRFACLVSVDAEVDRRLRIRASWSKRLVVTWAALLVISIVFAFPKHWNEERDWLAAAEVLIGTVVALCQIPNKDKSFAYDEDLTAVALCILALAALVPATPSLRSALKSTAGGACLVALAVVLLAIVYWLGKGRPRREQRVRDELAAEVRHECT